MVNYTV